MVAAVAPTSNDGDIGELCRFSKRINAWVQIRRGLKQYQEHRPVRLDGTLNPISPMRTLPIAVLAVTLALPCKVSTACAVSVTS